MLHGPDSASPRKSAKSFLELVDIVIGDHRNWITRFERPSKALLQLGHWDPLKEVAHSKVAIDRLRRRCERLADINADKKIGKRRKALLADVEFRILRGECHADPWTGTSHLPYLRQQLADLLDECDRIRNPPKRPVTVNEGFEVGKRYPSRTISRAYDGHVWEVLKSHFHFVPREKGQQAAVELIARLPVKDEYLTIKDRHFTKSVERLVHEAHAAVTELQEEMALAYENTPEALQDGEVGLARSEAADALESISEDFPEVPPSIATSTIVHCPHPDRASRRARADGVAAMLGAAARAAAEHRDMVLGPKAKQRRALEEFVAEVERVTGELDDVYFPGMYG